MYTVQAGGLRQTVVDLPASVRLQGLQTTYVPEPYEEERSWRVRLPVVALRPELPGYFSYGAELHYSAPYFLA